VKKYLFQCAIGPVQDFIASARRSRDLWYGSWLLSELAKAAAKALADRYQLDSLIFPAPQNREDLMPSSPFTAPNKVVAIVDGDPDGVAKLVKDAINSRLQALWKDARGKVAGRIEDDLARKQLDDLVEFYWVSVPVVDGDYKRARTLAEALLAARKSTRDFSQFNGSSVPKSSLDGSRESVIPPDAYPRGANDPRQEVKTRNLYRHYRARRGEQLSGVDLLKRLGERGKSVEQRFRSTSHMAALPLLAMIRREKGGTAVQQLFDEIQQFLAEEEIDAEDKDGSLLYESRLREWVSDEAKLNEVRGRLKVLLKTHSGTSVEPGAYYVLLQADGDNMGQAIDNQPDLQSHQRLSKALSEFAAGVSGIVEKHDGVPIFSGGDDVLAYLPLHTVLQCANDLAEKFEERLKGFSFRDGAVEKSPTLSIGIAVVHHLDPLSDSLELTRQAEKEAKGVTGKDALAVTVSKRSGVDRTVAGPRQALAERLGAMIGFLRRKKIGKGAAYELQELHRLLGTSGLPEVALSGEALRIIQRKRESGGSRGIDEEVHEKFTAWIENSEIDIGELAQELMVAGVFADAQDMAEGSLAPVQEETV